MVAPRRQLLGLPRSAFESVLDMLAGRYPSDEFAELRPRLVWDRVAGTLTGRPGAQRLAVTSGGTIPDRGLFGVFLAGSEKAARVGELDEEMVYESRAGDVFTLGSTSWRIEDITHDRVLVSPAPGQPGRLPFWKGDALGRPVELGRALGAFVRELGALTPEAARERVLACGLDAWAADNLLAYLTEQREATGHVPDDRTIVIERFRDELGDWRIAIHSPYGAQVHAPWALAVAPGCASATASTCRPCTPTTASCCGCPTPSSPTSRSRRRPTSPCSRPTTSRSLVTAEVGGSALFASRFRECAARALLLPRRDPGRRTPLWQQRQRSAQLLSVASDYGSFPVVLETMRECLQDVFDLPGLVGLMRDVEARRVRFVEVETAQPSPFARSLLFGYVAAVPLRGRLARSPSAGRRRCRSTPRCSPSCSDRPNCASCSTSTRCSSLERDLQRLSDDRRARDARASPTCCACSARMSTAEAIERGARARLAGRTGGGPAGDPGAHRRRGALGRRRGRRLGCVTRSARRCPSGCPRRSSSRCVTRSSTWSPATPARTRRSTSIAVAERFGLGVGPRAAGARPAGRGRPGRPRRVPPRRRRHRVVRRRGAAHPPAALARRTPSRGRAGRRPRRSPGSCRCGSTSAATCADPTACCGSSSSCRALPVPASALESLVLPVAGHGLLAADARRAVRGR